MSKNRVIVEAVLAGQSHGSVARQYGVSKVWVGKLAGRRLGLGRERVHTPKSNPNATGDDTVARIVALRNELTAAGLDAGPVRIAALNRQECRSSAC